MEARFDWLTFSIKNVKFENLDRLVFGLFGLEFEFFEPTFGRYGYTKGFFYEHITILTDGGRDFMGVCFEISGQGISYLYSLESFDFKSLFAKINHLDGSISRLDVALDCFDNELNYNVIAEAISVRNYCSKWKTVKVIHSYGVKGIGFDAQFGSRRSDIMLRIYDKKVESGSDLDYWCRVELQFRHDIAHAFVDTFLCVDEYSLFEKFAAVLSYYLRFIDRKYGYGNTDKCSTLAWWDEFIDKIASPKCNLSL